jgi:Xaa-Pro aminopeptidase
VLLETHTERPFTEQELSSRLSATRAGMDALGVDVALVTDQDDIFYLTGVTLLGEPTLSALLVGTSGELLLVSRRREAPAPVPHAGVARLALSNSDEPESAIARAVAVLGGSRPTVGVQRGSPSVHGAQLLRLRGLLQGARLVDATRLVWDRRATKSERELELMREAARVNAHVLDRAVAAIEPGVTDSEIAAELFGGMLEAGGDDVGFMVVASGEHTCAVQATCEDRELRAHDHVRIELSAARRRYHAPLARTITVGRPSAVVEHLHAGAQAGLQAALGAIRPGVTCQEVDAAARSAIVDLGLRRSRNDATGYSVGIATGPDWPEGHILTLREGDETILRENMTFHLPMFLSEPGVAGAGLTETVRVTENGVELITSYRQELIRL